MRKNTAENSTNLQVNLRPTVEGYTVRIRGLAGFRSCAVQPSVERQSLIGT